MTKKCSRCELYLDISLFGRYSSSKDGFRGTCKQCRSKYDSNGNKERCARNYELRKESYSIKAKTYREINRYKLLLDKKEYYKRNKEIISERNLLWVKNNPDKRKQIASRYKKKNNGVINANTAKRSAAKLKATPNWLSEEQLREIQNIYKESANLTKLTGIEHHVDHIIPLRNKFVCGLHVPWNLRIITKDENLRKSNKVEGING